MLRQLLGVMHFGGHCATRLATLRPRREGVRGASGNTLFVTHSAVIVWGAGFGYKQKGRRHLSVVERLPKSAAKTVDCGSSRRPDDDRQGGVCSSLKAIAVVSARSCFRRPDACGPNRPNTGGKRCLFGVCGLHRRLNVQGACPTFRTSVCHYIGSFRACQMPPLNLAASVGSATVL